MLPQSAQTNLSDLSPAARQESPQERRERQNRLQSARQSAPASQPAPKPPVLVWSRPPVQLELFPWMKPGQDNRLSRASLPAWFDPSQPLLPRSPPLQIPPG
jgi:hypothetical protein